MSGSPGRTKTIVSLGGGGAGPAGAAAGRRSAARSNRLARSSSVLVSASSSTSSVNSSSNNSIASSAGGGGGGGSSTSNIATNTDHHHHHHHHHHQPHSHSSRLSGLISGTVRAVSHHKSKRSSSAPLELHLPDVVADASAAGSSSANSGVQPRQAETESLRSASSLSAGDTDGDGNGRYDAERNPLSWHSIPPVPGPFTSSPGAEGSNSVSLALADFLGVDASAHALIEDMPVLPQAHVFLQGPLLSPDLLVPMYPHLIDVVVGSLPPDAWDWVSTEAEITTPHDDLLSSTKARVEEIKPTIESVLTKDKRGHVVLNLWETEQNYVAQLGVIQKVFRQRLSEREIISETAIGFIFAGTEELYALHLRFRDNLENAISVNNWSTTDSRIGSLFVEQKDEFVRTYTRFIDNYAISHKSMKKEEKTNEEYQSFMKEVLKLRETNRQTLKDFLILPVQRTTRYHLFLKDLVKNTPDDHPDKKDLEMAWEAMNQLAAMVNEKKRREEEATGLFDTFEMTKHCPPTLISHKRRLIMRCDSVIEKNTRRDVQVILCSDLLMFNVPTRSGVLGFSRSSSEYPYRFVRWLDLLELNVVDLSAEEGLKDCVRITIDSFKRPASRPSQTTAVQDVSQSSIAKELAGNTITFMFVGFEASKNANNFRLAIQAEMKSCRDLANSI